MANPNISLLGATYSDVSGVSLPKQGGGTATFPWVEGSQTITQNNTYDVTNLAQVVVNVSGGGGASNIVTGTFKGTTTGAAMDVSIPYSGNGYPIALSIFPTGGVEGNSTFANLIKRYAVALYSFIKNDTTTPPTYQVGTSDPADKGRTFYMSKSSTTSATSWSSTALPTNRVLYENIDSSNATSATQFIRLKNSTTMSVFIQSESTGYGFPANIEYTYVITYSS